MASKITPFLMFQESDAEEAMRFYGFSRKFCWVSDRFGVPWQLNLQ